MTLPDDYARCHGAYDPPLGTGYALLAPDCRDCLRRSTPVERYSSTRFMTPPDFTTTCPERIAP